MANTFGFASFSSGYVLIHGAEVRTWRENEAHIDENLYKRIANVFGRPVIGFIGGSHYELTPSRQVLSNQVAIPASTTGSDEPEALLVRR